MADVDESALSGRGVVRNQRINARLRRILAAAGDDAGVDVVRVFSGGQPRTGAARKGSNRHDDGGAADLHLIKGGRTLNFNSGHDLDVFRQFVTSAASYGANGIGAGTRYMGPTSLHVGFGNGPGDTRQVVWGANDAAVNAPGWLRDAARRGWANPVGLGAEVPNEAWSAHSSEADMKVESSEVERFRPLLDFIALNEVGTTGPKGYNTSLGHGRYLPGRVEQNLVDKSLGEIDRLQTAMLQNGAKSTAIGRYQFLKGTLGDLRRWFGLTDSDIFTAELQDRLGVALIKRRGKSVTGLRNEWESFKTVDGAAMLAKYDESGPVGGHPDDAPPDLWARFLQWLRDRPAEGGSDGDWPQLSLGKFGDDVKRLQTTLNSLGYFTGGADGNFGPLTREAVAAFQVANGLQVDGIAGAETWRALTTASRRPLPEQRIDLTAGDLRRLGSQTVRNADFVRYAGWTTGALGLGGVGNSLWPTGMRPPPAVTVDSLNQTIDDVRSILVKATDPSAVQSVDAFQQAVQKAMEFAKVHSLSLGSVGGGQGLDTILPAVLGGLVPGGLPGSIATLGLGLAFHLLGTNIIDRRVQDQRDGKHVGESTF